MHASTGNSLELPEFKQYCIHLCRDGGLIDITLGFRSSGLSLLALARAIIHCVVTLSKTLYAGVQGGDVIM